MKLKLMLILLLATMEVVVSQTSTPTTTTVATTVASSFTGFCRPVPTKPPPPPPSCENGPQKIIHTVRGEFHWPPIFRGSCFKLKCKDPPCFVRKQIWRYRCVLVYKLIHGYWVKIGYRTRRFIDHVKCGCKACSDIRSRTTCARTKPCPNSYKPKSFCYPTHGKCNCCVPYPCPKGQIFDRTKCSCVCPKGSRLIKGKCIGDCKAINPFYCKSVYCKDNPAYTCLFKNHKCTCFSCDDQTNLFQCPRTRCVEQRNKPYCFYDKYFKKCRCPKCQDQTNRKDCLNTYCGYQRCKYLFHHRSHKNRCVCPY